MSEDGVICAIKDCDCAFVCVSPIKTAFRAIAIAHHQVGEQLLACSTRSLTDDRTRKRQPESESAAQRDHGC